MLLAAFDVGNTRFHAGLFAPTSDGVAVVEVRSAARPDLDFFRRWRVPVADAVYASVNPGMDRIVERTVLGGWGVRPRRMGRDFPAAIHNRTRRPAATGLDRLANAVAAWRRCRRACAVVDLGTAITFDLIDARGRFLGGAIAPGLRLQARALNEGTGLLPLAPPKVRTAPGRETREAIQVGLTWGISGLVREGIRRTAAHVGTRPYVFGTGGDAERFRDLFDEVVPHLTLEGIALSFLARA
ncbi:MAG: type III pantothenate kinase [Planctomycetes bacterium]|nr:type III pantothenate kinase [Planctomycetota bacterium]